MRKRIDQQRRHNDCGISAIKTVCNVLGVNIGREIIEDSIPLSEAGASLGNMYQFLQAYGFQTNFQLLDVNSINGNYQELKSYLPCIVPVKNQGGLHYVVIKDLDKDKFIILDSAESRPYKLNVAQLKKKAFFGSSFIDYLDLETALKSQLKETLNPKGIQLPSNLSNSDILAWANKLTYFSHIEHNFGFASQEIGNQFLKDLLFNQDLQHIPTHFRSLLPGADNQVEIKTPILLSVKRTPVTQEAPSPFKSIYWRLWKKVADYKTLSYIFLATVILTAIIEYFAVFINQLLIDHVVPAYDLRLLYLFGAGVGVFFTIQTLFKIYSRFVSIHLGNSLNRFFLQTFDEKINRFSIRYLQEYKKGDLIERLSDSMELQRFFTSTFVEMVVSIFTASISLLILFSINKELSLFTLVVLALFVAIFYIFTPIIERLEKERYKKKAEYMSRFIEKIDGIQVIKSMNLEDYSSNQIRGRINDLIEINTKTQYTGLANIALSSFIITIATLFILIYASKEMILANSISLGMILTFTSLSGKVFAAFEDILEKNLELQEYKVVLQRFFDFEETHFAKNKSTNAAQNKEHPTPFTPFPSSLIRDFKLEKLELENVGFSYDKENFIFADVNLSIQSRQKIWIEGKNGTGKSTMCKVLGLLYEPDQGAILVNGISSKLYAPKMLRKKILYISGDDMIFNESILFNITFGKTIDLKKLIELAKAIKFYEFIDSHPDKFNYIIHENGSNLSTGQKKKLLLLRALMSNAQLIIFDEIFNGMDAASKKNAEIIIDFFTDRSFILISHIPSEFISFHKKYKLNHGILSEISPS